MALISATLARRRGGHQVRRRVDQCLRIIADDQIGKLFMGGGGHKTVLNSATGFEDKVLEDLALNYLACFVLSKLSTDFTAQEKHSSLDVRWWFWQHVGVCCAGRCRRQRRIDIMRKLNGAQSSRINSQTVSRSAGTGLSVVGAEMTGWRHDSTFPAEGVP